MVPLWEGKKIENGLPVGIYMRVSLPKGILWGGDEWRVVISRRMLEEKDAHMGFFGVNIMVS